jgi:YD repeat-containing protein
VKTTRRKELQRSLLKITISPTSGGRRSIGNIQPHTLRESSTDSLRRHGGRFGFSYDALRRRTQMTRPNGVTHNYTVDPAGNRTAKKDT